MRDLIVIGGGPTGLATAIEARLAGLDVVLCEPRPYPIDKSCGEGLMPAALDSLKRLGVDRPQGKPFRGIAITSSGATAVGEFSDGHGLGVRRTELSRVLHARALATGVKVEKRRMRDVRSHDTHVEVAVSKSDKPLRARWVVAADGIHSATRAKLGIDVRPARRQRWGLRAHFETKPWTDCVQIYCSDRGEAYVTPIGDRTVGVALLSEAPGPFDDQMKSYPDLADRLGARIGRVQGAGPFPSWTTSLSSGRVLFAGDAAGFADPITGEGIQLGLAAAALAVEAVCKDDPAAYQREWQRMTRNYRVVTAGILAVRRNRLTDRLMVPTLRSIPFVFRSVLDLLGGESDLTQPTSYQTTTLGGSSVFPPHSTLSS